MSPTGIMLAIFSLFALGISNSNARLPDSSMVDNRTPKKFPAVRNSDSRKNGIACDGCETFITWMHDELARPEIENRLKSALAFLCKEVVYGQECQEFLRKYDQYFEKLQQYLADPKQVCQDYAYCGGSSIGANSTFLKELLQTYFKGHFNVTPETGTQPNNYCDRCIHDVQKVKRWADDPTAKQEFELKFESICRWCPARLQCNSRMAGYADMIIDQIASCLQNPHKFCQEIQLC